MSVTYFNRNTGDTARLDEPSERLDALDNWVRVKDGEDLPPVVNDGILSRPSLAGPRASQAPGQTLVETTPPEPGDVPVQPTPPIELTPISQVGDPVTGDPQMPGKNGSKADWQAYARTRAQDSDEEAAIEKMSRDDLAAKYGGGS